MKRSTPLKRTPLARRTPLRSRPKARKRTPAEIAWKTPRWGRCEACGLIDDEPLHGHHIVSRQMVARAGGDEWNPANRLDLCGTCHFNHEFDLANRKIPLGRIPVEAVDFAADLLGEDLAMVYLLKHYQEAEA